MENNYDLIVIGGGSAGLIGAKLASALGKKVALVEKSKLGGDCLLYGCVPSKSLISMNKLLHSPFIKTLGLEFKPYEIDFSKIAKDIQETIDEIAIEDSESALKKDGVSTIFGFAKFIDKNTIDVDGKQYTAKCFLIASGSKPFIPKLNGLENIKYITNENVFSLPKLPKTLTVLGGGPIGCEMAQAFALLGSKVHIIQRNERLLPKDDKSASEFILEEFKRNNIDVHLKDEIIEITKDGESIKIKLASGKEISSDELLISIGRSPNIEGMNLEKINIEVSKNGININEYLQTTISNIYAAGDVAGPFLFTHFASYQASVAVSNAFLPGILKTKFKYLSMPWVTFVSPEIAHAGLTEDEIIEKNIPYRKIHFPYAKIDRAITEKKKEGFIDVYIDNKDYVLGSTIIGERSGELIMEFILAIDNKIKISKVMKSIHPYPTYASGIQAAIYKDYLVTSKAIKFFRKFF